MARAVAYSPDGTSIAVGIGGRVGRGKNRDDGKWLVIRESDLEKVRGLLNMQCAGVRREGCEAELSCFSGSRVRARVRCELGHVLCCLRRSMRLATRDSGSRTSSTAPMVASLESRLTTTR